MDTQQQHSTEVVGCPRCDYDLGGEVQRWEDQCPTEGVCPECGLEIRWGSILGTDARRPEWFFETSRANPLRAFLQTFRRARNPFRYWNWVKMEYEFKGKRMVILSVGGMFGLHAILVLVTVGLCVVFHTVALFNRPAAITTVPSLSDNIMYSLITIGFPFVYEPAPRWFYTPNPDQSSGWVFVAIISAVVMPIAYTLLSSTLSKAKVRTVHLVRVMGYSLAWMPLAWFALTGVSVVYALLVEYDWLTDIYYITTPSSRRALVFSVVGTGNTVSNTILDKSDLAITLLVAFGWNITWWWCAGKWYLKIPNAFLVSIMLTMLSTLAVIILTLPLCGMDAISHLFLR